MPSILFIFIFLFFNAQAAPPDLDVVANYIATQTGKTFVSYENAEITSNGEFYAVEYNGLRMNTFVTGGETQSFAVALVPVDGGNITIDTVVQYHGFPLGSVDPPFMQGKNKKIEADIDFYEVGRMLGERIGKVFIDYDNVVYDYNDTLTAGDFNGMTMFDPVRNQETTNLATVIVSNADQNIFTIDSVFEYIKLSSKLLNTNIVKNNKYEK